MAPARLKEDLARTTSTLDLKALELTPVSGRFPTRRLPEVTARDKRTLEVRQMFALPHKKGEERTYQTSLTFYFARGFGISRQTYGHEAFYRDANVYMRLHAPEMGLKKLADPHEELSPAGALRKLLPKLLEETAPSAESLELLTKMLGAELADAVTSDVRAFSDRVRQLKHHPGRLRDLEPDLNVLCGDMLRALAAVRRLRAKGRAYRTVAPATFLPSLAFAEEYAIAVVDERIAELARDIDAAPHLRDGSGTAVRLRLTLARTAEQVLRRRHEQGFPTPAGDAPEYFTYRTGLLKKEVQRALYVDTRASTRDPFYRNSAAMVAAGLAATWATLAQVPIMTGGLTTGQYGLFLGTAVGAYILKDRIKEWVRLSLSKKLLQWDHDRHIVGDGLKAAGLGAFGGRAQERVRWLDTEEVKPGVARLRAKHRTVRGVAPELEHILSYERKVTFEAGDQPTPEGFGVQELFRISMDEFVKRLDDPVDPVAYYDPKSATFRQAEMPKVYHLNLIATCTDAQTHTSVVARWRVVVNQAGIVYVDPVATRFEEPNAPATSLTPAAAE